LIAESRAAGGAAALVLLATVTTGVCAPSAAANATVAASIALEIRVIVYFFCVGGVLARVTDPVLLADPTPD
jgi:hypothetical protein